MIYRKIVIFLTFLCCLISSAKEYEKNIYIYRNDGKISAFLSNEVDSLKYSNVDLEGKKHENNIIQEVWTPDSVYRIPLSVIDSISVHTLETEFAPEVKHLYPDYVPYIKGSRDMTLRFSTELPYKMNIKKGDILLYDRFDDLFENGFAGRVISITNDGALNVECEQVGLADIYQQFLGFGESLPDNYYALKTPQKKSLDYGIECGLSINPILRPLVYVKDGNVYIELTIGVSYDYNASFQFEGFKKKEFDLGSGKIPISQPIPGVLFTLGYSNFAELVASGEIELGFYGGGQFTRTIKYEDGIWNLGENQFAPEKNTLDGSISATGSISVGSGLTVGIEFVGRLFSAELNPSFGRCFEFDVSKKFSEFNKSTFYEWVKDASLTFSHFAEIKMIGKTIFGKGNKEFKLPLTGRVKYNTSTDYLLPEFSDLEITTDNESLTVSATASRRLFQPCRVGFAVLDEQGNEVDSYFETSPYFQSAIKLNRTFNKGLKPGVKYSVRPVVTLFNHEMYATPQDETYLDCKIITGPGTATIYSAELSGTTEDELESGTEVGFVYSAVNKNPTFDNSQHCTGQMINDNLFKSGCSGLRAGTTYYYRAYAHYNNQYYYGDAQCITTKKNCDHSDDDNFGGDFKKGRKLYVSTGKSYEIEQRSAQIEFTFNCVNPGTECGYYLEADDKRGSKMLSQYHSVGTVTGVHTIELDNLIPGTTYRYWPVAKNSLGSASGSPRTFKTEPSPDPSGTIVEITDIDMNSASVKCYFENMEADYSCGIILSDGKWSYSKTVKPDEGGGATIKLDRLVAETDYNITTYISTDPEEEPIVGKKTTKFSTEGPDITGMWGFWTKGVFGGGDYYDLEILANGKTNRFYGVNYCYWTRNGREITLKLNNIVGGYESPTYYLFKGEFNEDFTEATGRAIYVQDAYWVEIYDELSNAGPFTLRRK